MQPRSSASTRIPLSDFEAPKYYTYLNESPLWYIMEFEIYLNWESRRGGPGP
jgi:hypothetical protein